MKRLPRWPASLPRMTIPAPEAGRATSRAAVPVCGPASTRRPSPRPSIGIRSSRPSTRACETTERPTKWPSSLAPENSSSSSIPSWLAALHGTQPMPPANGCLYQRAPEDISRPNRCKPDHAACESEGTSRQQALARAARQFGWKRAPPRLSRYRRAKKRGLSSGAAGATRAEATSYPSRSDVAFSDHRVAPVCAARCCMWPCSGLQE
ncbi:hypothetical protein ABIE89_000281 [Bradyrhizobium niftali]